MNPNFKLTITYPSGLVQVVTCDLAGLSRWFKMLAEADPQPIDLSVEKYERRKL